MQRLRKGREVEQKRDIREVQRDMSLIKSPAAGMQTFIEITAIYSSSAPRGVSVYCDFRIVLCVSSYDH